MPLLMFLHQQLFAAVTADGILIPNSHKTLFISSHLNLPFVNATNGHKNVGNTIFKLL